jgi:phage tail sheath gpL-like
VEPAGRPIPAPAGLRLEESAGPGISSVIRIWGSAEEAGTIEVETGILGRTTKIPVEEGDTALEIAEKLKEALYGDQETITENRDGSVSYTRMFWE